MEKNFTNENFENFLQQNADGLRMRPSEKVWKNISKKLNRRKRRIGFAIGSLLLAISTIGYFALDPGTSPVSAGGATASQDQHNTANGATLPLPAEINETAPLQSGPSNNQVLSQPGLLTADEGGIVIPMKSSPLASNYNPNLESSGKQDNSLAENSNFRAETITSGSNIFEATIIDNDPELKPVNNAVSEKETEQALYPQTIESVVNLVNKPLKKKTSIQFYFTPTVSYRRLSENKAFLLEQNNGTDVDVNNNVTHKPDMGFELGMAVRYQLSEKLRLRAGFQFNVNRYDIKAFNSSAAVTTVLLNSPGNRVDSITSYTRHSNVGSGNGDWFENFYFQISMPLGAEFIFAGNDKVKFGVGATLQPSYMIGEKSYMITHDFKSYTHVPSLVRHFNINTGLETFIEYSTGRLNWQIGPQFRYQLLSSFDKEYPVKEHLFNYGLKVGISLNNDQ